VLLKNKLYVVTIAGGLALIFWCALFVVGLFKYPGSALMYTLFSVVYLGVLISGFVRQVSYGYMFLSTMLWLGFWMKLTVHLWLSYPFVEPVGLFKSSQVSWDQVLLVATLGGAGLFVGRLIYALFRRPSTLVVDSQQIWVPDWYSGIRRGLWTVLIVSCIVLALVNATLGIGQAGLVPRTILVFPMNALIYWLLSYGLALAVASLLWWDVCQERKISLVVYAVLLESLLSSISLLSRATYVFHTVPMLTALFKSRKIIVSFSGKKTLLLLVMFVVLLFGSLRAVNALRAQHYSDKQISLHQRWEALSQTDTTSLWRAAQPDISSMFRGVQFFIDRWVGLEGIMAVQSYPGKSMDLFVQQLTERSRDGKHSVYQEISLAHYRFMDLSKFRFSSLPGPIAFLYSSDSLWLVFIGMFIFCIVVLAGEYLVHIMTYNPIVSALWGGMMANAVAQIGVAPIGLVKFIALMVGGIVTIYIIQSKTFSTWVYTMKHSLASRKCN
jgi:hypothetical protein